MLHRWRPVSIALGGLVALAALAEDGSLSPSVEGASVDGALTLPQAVGLALEGSPRLAAFAWELRAAEARKLQAGLRPNPELGVEVEDIRWSPGPVQETRTLGLEGALERGAISIPDQDGGPPLELPVLTAPSAVSWEREREQGTRSGFTEAEFTISIAQVFELGGKRAKRVAVAEQERQLALWDYETARAEVIAEVAFAYVAVLTAQESLRLQEELLSLADEVVRVFRQRVKAGQVSPLEESRAEVAQARTQITRQQAARELNAGRARLAATWGAKGVSFTQVLGRLDEAPLLPSFDDLYAGVRANPDVARWVTELAFRDAELALVRAGRSPDPTLEFGFRSAGLADHKVSRYGFGTGGSFGFSRSETGFDSDRDNTLVVGFSIPLPIFDRNQGSIAAAEAIVSKTSEERRAVEVEIHTALVEGYEAAAASLVEIEALRDDVMPKATEIYEKTQRGYREGKFGYLDVLDAQGSLFDARSAYLEALSLFHQAVVQIERLTGESLARWSEQGDAVDLEKSDAE